MRHRAAGRCGSKGDEQVKHDIAGFDKANFNGFFVQSRNEQFRLNIGAYASVSVQLGLARNTAGWRPKVRFGLRRGAHAFLLRRKDDGPHRVSAALQYRRHGDFSLLIAYAGYNFKNYHHRSANNGGAWNLTGRAAVHRHHPRGLDVRAGHSHDGVLGGRPGVRGRHLGWPSGVLWKGPRSGLVCAQQRSGRWQGRLPQQHDVPSASVGAWGSPAPRR